MYLDRENRTGPDLAQGRVVDSLGKVADLIACAVFMHYISFRLVGGFKVGVVKEAFADLLGNGMDYEASLDNGKLPANYLWSSC